MKTAADKNPGHLKMALVNSKTEFTDTTDKAENQKTIARNLTRHFYFIDKLAAQGVEFIGFPEASINGYHYSANMTWLSRNGPEVKALQDKARQNAVYLSAGLAEIDGAGKKWEAQFVIDPAGEIIGWQRKAWLTKEKGLIESSNERQVFEVKGMKMGIVICADGSDFNNLQELADQGARIIYGPHANTTGGNSENWYKFRARWYGPASDEYCAFATNNDGPKAPMPGSGWIAKLKVYAALHNHAALYNSQYNAPRAADENSGWASGALFIAPDGSTLAQLPSSNRKEDSKESVLTYNVPLKRQPSVAHLNPLSQKVILKFTSEVEEFSLT